MRHLARTRSRGRSARRSSLPCAPSSGAAARGASRSPAHGTREKPPSAVRSGATIAEAPVPVPASAIPPAGRRLSADRVLAIAEALPKMRAVRRKYRGSYGGAYLKGPLRWQVSFFSAKGAKEIGQVIIADATGRVLEQWTGFQVAWTMARGYPGAFGGHVNALYVWLPLCLLFVLPFFDLRRPFSLLHLDLLVLLSFSVSLAFFNHAHIYASVPLTYPPLLYLLARMLALLRRRSGRRTPPGERAARPLRLLVPAPVAGARRRLPARLSHRAQRDRLERDRRRLRGRDRRAADRPRRASVRRLSRQTTNTATPTARSTTRRTCRSSRSSAGAAPGTTCRPRTPRRSSSTCSRSRCCSCSVGACAARRSASRSPTRGSPIPFTLFALESNSNDTLVAVLVLAALLAQLSPARRPHAARSRRSPA